MTDEVRLYHLVPWGSSDRHRTWPLAMSWLVGFVMGGVAVWLMTSNQIGILAN
jgi:hypothetical protein